MGLKDALYLLENEGYKVTFSGTGKGPHTESVGRDNSWQRKQDNINFEIDKRT